MKRWIAGIMVTAMAGAACGAAAPAAPVPTSPDWSPSLLVVLVWVLAAVLVVGPLARYLKLEPRDEQVFSDDPPAPR